MGGIEPTNSGVKVRCLTTWLHPIDTYQLNYINRLEGRIYVLQKCINNERGGIRTPDTIVRSHVL